MDDEQVLERKLERWASMLEREDKVEHALRRLESVSINLRLLTITGIGKSVNSLRKHPKLGDRVTALVTRWKDIARAETAAAAAKQQQETSDHSSGSNNSNDEEEHDSGEEEQAEEAISEAKKSSVPHVRSNPKEPQRRKRPLPIVNEIQLNGHRRREPEVDDDEPLDPFSAQLASADRVVFVRRAVKKKHAKITAESIQDSLLDSLANPTLGQQATVAVVQKPAPSQSHQFYTHEPISTDIMFKAPKENRRVYAGRKRNATPADQEVPRLYDICIRVLTNNIDAIEETGDIPFDILQPVLEKANAAQLRRLEEKNPHLQEETDPLWVTHCERDFAKEFAEMLAVLENQKNGEDEEEEEEDADMMDFYQMDGLSWRQRYQKFARERERRLRQLSNKIKSKTNEIIEPQRQTMVTAPIAPRNVRRRQIQNGMTISADRVPTAMQLTKARRQIFETGNDADLRQMPSAIRNTTSKLGSRPGGGGFHSATASTTKKPQRGPLMLKTLKMLKQQRR